MKLNLYLDKLTNIELKLSDSIKLKIKAINLAFNEFEIGSYPLNNLPFLPLNSDELLELSILNYNDPDLENKISILDHLLYSFRDVVIDNFGIYGIFNEQLIDHFSSLLESPVLEIAAGNGFLANRIAKRGLNITAIDNESYLDYTSFDNQFYPIFKTDAVEYLKNNIGNYKTLLLSWSPDSNLLDYKILNLLRKSNLDIPFYVIGERNGKTNSSKFWQEVNFIKVKEMLHLNHYFRDFDLYHDRIYLIK